MSPYASTQRAGRASGKREKWASPPILEWASSQTLFTGGRAEGVVLALREEVDALVLAVGTAAAALGHGVLLAPPDLAADEPAGVAEGDDEAVGEGEEVAVGEPGDGRVDEGAAAAAGLGVGGVGVVEAAAVGAEGGVDAVVLLPVDGGVVGVAEVDPGDAAGLELGEEAGEEGGEAREVGARVGLAAEAGAGALAPVGRARDDEVDRRVGERGGEGEAVALGDAVEGEGAERGEGLAASGHLRRSARAWFPLPVLK